MQIKVTFTNSKDEKFEWTHETTKTVDWTIELLREHYDAVKITIVVQP